MVTVGIVSPGAMGSGIGAALLRGGARVVATLAGRSERTAGLARRAGLECLGDLRAVVSESDVVLSILPPGEAEAAAADVARAGGGEAPLLCDLNAVSPATAQRISSSVDGAISGPPPWEPGRTTIYLSGPRAAEVAALPFDGVEVIVVGAEVGLASAVKMSTGAVYKGNTAVLAQALLAARANGVLEHVLRDLGSLADGAGPQIAHAASKSRRFAEEMREIAATQAAAGLPPDLFEAFALVYERFAGSGAARRAPEDVVPDEPLGAVLAALDD